jgi:glycosyltransferase involved in cell wall biosynthesis
MRVLQISSAKDFGGGERHFCDLADGLSDRGVTVFVAVRPECTWREKLDRVPEDRIVEVPLRGSADARSTFALSRLIREQRIDIVHAHVARDYVPAAVAVRLAGRAGLVLTRHVLFPMSRFSRFFLRNVSRVIAVSSAVETNLLATFPQEKIVEIPNGISLERFAGARPDKDGADFRNAYGIPSDAKVVATVGELKPLKGQEDFVLAAAEIVKKVPEAYFLVIGKDNSRTGDFRRRLRRLSKVLGIEERCKFLDWVEDTAPLLSALDVLVSASHSESFGLAILEGMASGKPVVATATAGAKELIQDRKSGLLADIKDPVSIANAVVRVLRDEAFADSIGGEARKRAQSGFSIEKMVGATAALYGEIVDQASAAR